MPISHARTQINSLNTDNRLQRWFIFPAWGLNGQFVQLLAIHVNYSNIFTDLGGPLNHTTLNWFYAVWWVFLHGYIMYKICDWRLRFLWMTIYEVISFCLITFRIKIFKSLTISWPFYQAFQHFQHRRSRNLQMCEDSRAEITTTSLGLLKILPSQALEMLYFYTQCTSIQIKYYFGIY